jgi:alpha-beta hydrolase superfamily lysophospholipase
VPRRRRIVGRAVFARLIERAAARGLRAVAFDHPGHTPADLLGPHTPAPSLLALRDAARARARSSRRCSPTLVAGSPRVQLVAHSAGALDAAAVSGAAAPRRRALRAARHRRAELRRDAARAARRREARHGDGADWRAIARTRALPTGHAAFHFGPRAARAVGDEVLAAYQGPEHVAVVAKLFAQRSLAPRRWAGTRVDLVASAGDLVAPPAVMEELRRWLAARGADAALHVIAAPLPHMFMMFGEAAERVVDVLAASD